MSRESLVINMIEDLHKVVTDLNTPGAFTRAYFQTGHELSTRANKLVLTMNENTDENTAVNIMQADIWICKAKELCYKNDRVGAVNAFNEAILYLNDMCVPAV
jgi:hypothetical protein